jgi:DtxR family Mn-dependent transcriptional regulator
MPKQLGAEIAALPELASTSEAEQMYLITIARAAEAGTTGPVSISRIAQELQVSVPSANEMVRKLDGRGLLAYEPYHGASLSDAGRYLADQVLRTRRLWATFLADHLRFSPDEADAQACALEHDTTPEAADRLAAYLGNPAAGPLGRPIPETIPSTSSVPATLADLPVGVPAEVVAVAASGAGAEFLQSESITPGTTITVSALGVSGLLVEIQDHEVHLSNRMAAMVAVQRREGRREPA